MKIEKESTQIELATVMQEISELEQLMAQMNEESKQAELRESQMVIDLNKEKKAKQEKNEALKQFERQLIELQAQMKAETELRDKEIEQKTNDLNKCIKDLEE